MACAWPLFALSACTPGGAYFIPGTGDLPECSDEPAANLDATEWFDSGTVTIRTAGCPDAQPSDSFASCPLNWVFAQDGRDLTITVDEEYRIEARLCGDELFLRGGWWLPVEDQGSCTYDDDSADEVRIQSEGNRLVVSEQQIAGTLAVSGKCDADYEVIFAEVAQLWRP